MKELAEATFEQELLEAIDIADEKVRKTKHAHARSTRYVICFIPINTREYKMGLNQLRPGRIEQIEPYAYMARGENPSWLDRLAEDFAWEETAPEEEYETLPGYIVSNLKSIYEHWGLTDIEVLTGERDRKRINEIQLDIFPEGPNAKAFQGKNMWVTRQKYLESLRAEFPEASVERSVLECYIESHRTGMRYLRRWAQQLMHEAHEAQTKNGKSGRTFLEPWECDLFNQLGYDLPDYMSVRLEGEDFIPTTKAAIATAAPISVKTEVPSELVEAISLLALGQNQLAQMIEKMNTKPEPSPPQPEPVKPGPKKAN